MTVRTHRRRFLAKSTVLVLAVIAAFVAITAAARGATSGPPASKPASTSSSPARSGSATSPTKDPAAAPTPLVQRMLADLRQGRSTASEDQPLAGAPVRAILAHPGQHIPIGRLRIPAIGVDTRIFDGIDEAALAKGPGHWPGTPLPGQAGNSVLSGHRSTNTKPFLFLDRLHRGDAVIVRLGHTTPVTFRVTRTTIVRQSQYVPFVLKQPKQHGLRELTMFACNPLTAHYQRIVVQARVAG